MHGELGWSRSCFFSRNHTMKEEALLGFSIRAAPELFQTPKQHRQRMSSSPHSVKLQAMASSGSVEEEREYELRVCTNRTCRKSGSLQTLELLKGLASPNITVESCGCLGRCGMGPNLVVLPAEIFVGHCNTAAHATRLLSLQCGLSDPENNLKALALKQQGVKAFELGDITGAEMLLSQAIELQPSGGLHLLYEKRSAVRLAKDDTNAALEDAKHAACLAPKWHAPLLRQGEAYMVLGDYHSAQSVYAKAVLLDPSVRKSKSYQRKVRELESMLTPVNTYV